jgi:hypothetical protein
MEEIADDETPYKLASPTAISISLSGNNPPFRVQYEVMGVNRKMEVRELTINEKQAQLPIDVFGAYRLISVQDSKCQGTAEPPVCKVNIFFFYKYIYNLLPAAAPKSDEIRFWLVCLLRLMSDPGSWRLRALGRLVLALIL